jgi:hypothetical protein
MVNYYAWVVFRFTAWHKSPLTVIQPSQEVIILSLVELELNSLQLLNLLRQPGSCSVFDISEVLPLVPRNLLYTIEVPAWDRRCSLQEIRLDIITLLQGKSLLLVSKLLNHHQKVFVFSFNLVEVLENNNLITEFVYLLLLSNMSGLHWFHWIEWPVWVWYKPNRFSEIKLLASINMQRIPL